MCESHNQAGQLVTSADFRRTNVGDLYGDPMTKEQYAALLTGVGALFWLPLIWVTFRDNKDHREVPVERDRFTDQAAGLAVVGVVFCAIAAVLLFL